MEMGCGSGLVSLHMAKAGAKVTAVDLDERAVQATEDGATMNGLDVKTVRSDLFSDVGGDFDLIIFNPPYLRGDVRGPDDLCWAGGQDGVQLTARFLKEAKEHLEPDGRVLLLVSDDMDPSALDEALSEWKVRTVASRTLFFEELRVLRLTL